MQCHATIAWKWRRNVLDCNVGIYIAAAAREDMNQTAGSASVKGLQLQIK